MDDALSCGEHIFKARALHVTNTIVAAFGGLSLLLPLTAPFNMMMSEWRSLADVLAATAICGGLPLICVVSIALSRMLFASGRHCIALAVALFVPLLLAAMIVWGVTDG